MNIAGIFLSIFLESHLLYTLGYIINFRGEYFLDIPIISIALRIIFSSKEERKYND